MDDQLLFIAVGFAAQLVDGAISMVYGLTGMIMLFSFGITPATASASVHAAETFTSLSHWRIGNVDWSLLRWLVIPGVIGGVAGTLILVFSLRVRLLWMLCAISIAGCASQVSEQSYPLDWPAFTRDAAGCSGISGLYLDHGTRTDADGGQVISSLAELLSEAPPPKLKTVRIEFPTNDEISLAGIDASRFTKVLNLRNDLTFVCRGGVPRLSNDHLTADPMAILREVVEISFFPASDGSLVAERTYRANGYMLFIPIADRSREWFRFERADE